MSQVSSLRLWPVGPGQPYGCLRPIAVLPEPHEQSVGRGNRKSCADGETDHKAGRPKHSSLVENKAKRDEARCNDARIAHLIRSRT